MLTFRKTSSKLIFQEQSSLANVMSVKEEPEDTVVGVDAVMEGEDSEGCPDST